jgi:hypothetical protein
VDWIITQTVSHEGLKDALARDSGTEVKDDHPLLTPPRAHTESLMVYIGVNTSNPTIPLDGTHVFTGT